MSLKLMYITNKPEIAALAQKAGIDRVWVDMEYIGKDLRQAGMDTVKSHHSVEDVFNLRSIITCSELMVRVNPIHDKTDMYCSSENEINSVIEAGADVIMLPYFKTREEVERFIAFVRGRTKTILLVETAEAVRDIDEILSVPGIDEAYIGLNDLHIIFKKKFMFQLLQDGTVDKLCYKFASKGIPYGFGGIARVGYGMLPAEYIIGEHYRLGSQMAIVSRGFCDANTINDVSTIEDIFIAGIAGIRKREDEVSHFTEYEFIQNHHTVCSIIDQIINE